jgi:hypothetical protein
MNDSEFLSWFDLARPSMREAKAFADKGDVHAAVLSAARNATEGPAGGAIHARDIAATRRAIQKAAPNSLNVELQRAEMLLRKDIPREEEMGYADNCKLGIHARQARKRGNDVLTFALLYATTEDRKWADHAIQAGLKLAAKIEPMPIGPKPLLDNEEARLTQRPSYSWHPHSPDHLGHDIAHQLQYWMQAWGLLQAAISDEDRLTWMKKILQATSDRLLSNRYEINFNLTYHPLLPTLQVAAAFPALRMASEWTSIVLDRIERDFCAAPFSTPEGYTREGTGYHNVNTRLLTISYLTALRGLNRDIPALHKACEGATAMQALFLCPDGSIWQLGDSASRGHHEHWHDVHENLHLGAAIFNRPEWKALTGSVAGVEPELLNLWLMGSEGIERWSKWPSADLKNRTYSNAHAPTATFHVMRSGKGMDGHAGILCFGMEHNHAHHDKGQVLLYGLGRHLLSDQGHPGYGGGDMVPGYSPKVHGVATPIRRTPMGPRTDYADYARSLGTFENDRVSVALAEHDYYENHTIQRALALVSPWGRNDPDAFWLMWDRITFKRGWPSSGNVPFEMVDTIFPFHSPGCPAVISKDGRSVWSQYDGPEGMPFVQRGPMRIELAEGNELSDSDANLQITRLNTAGSGAACDIQIRPGVTAATGVAGTSRPLAAYRWRGWLPHVSAYVLVPFRGVRKDEFAAVSGECDKDSIKAVVKLPRGKVEVTVTGLESRKINASVSA